MRALGIVSAVVAGFGALVAAIAAQATHIIVCVKSGQYLLLIAGFLVPPVGIWHGIAHWFGAW